MWNICRGNLQAETEPFQIVVMSNATSKTPGVGLPTTCSMCQTRDDRLNACFVMICLALFQHLLSMPPFFSSGMGMFTLGVCDLFFYFYKAS